MNLEKPIRIHSDLEDGSHLSCGLNSIISILYTLGFKINIVELNRKLVEWDKELKFGGIFTVDKIVDTLEFIKKTEGIEFNYKIKQFNSAVELDSILRESNEYALVCYYALQGFIRVSKHPSMEHSHFGVIYRYEDGKLWGSQSNNKANMLRCLEHVSIESFVESCNTVNKIKVNWGKYSKCSICIGKRQLEDKARCGKTECALGLENSTKCICSPTIGNKIILIGVNG